MYIFIIEACDPVFQGSLKFSKKQDKLIEC